jgi:hypothetical protein
MSLIVSQQFDRWVVVLLSLSCGLQKLLVKYFKVNGVVLQRNFVATRLTASIINIDKYITHIHL